MEDKLKTLEARIYSLSDTKNLKTMVEIYNNINQEIKELENYSKELFESINKVDTTYDLENDLNLDKTLLEIEDLINDNNLCIENKINNYKKSLGLINNLEKYLEEKKMEIINIE